MITKGYEEKIAYGFIIFTLLLLSSGLSSLWNLWGISQSNKRVHQSAHPVVRETNVIQIQLLKLANLSSLAFSEQDAQRIEIYQKTFYERALLFSKQYSDLEVLAANDLIDKKQVSEIKADYESYLAYTRDMFIAKIALQNSKIKVDEEVNEIISLVDQVGASFMEIVYAPVPDQYEKEMKLISGNINYADTLMVAIIRTAEEIKRTNDPERLKTGPDEFSFIVRDSMSWFDRSVNQFNKIDDNGLVDSTYTRVKTLERRLQNSPNLMDFKSKQFSHMADVHSRQLEANEAVGKCILQLDKLLDSADTRLEKLQAELAESVEFGYKNIFGTILVLIVLGLFHFNTVRLTINRKINDLAAINKIGRLLALVQNQESAFEGTLDTVYEQTGLNICSVVLMSESGELMPTGNYSIAIGQSKEKSAIDIPNTDLLKRVKNTKKSLFLHDISVEGINDEGRGSNHKALLYIPLKDGEELYGILCFSGCPTRTANRVLNDGEFEFFVSISSVLVSTLKNISMQEIIKKHNRSLEATVKDRTAALKQKSDDITGMLSNLHQGLFAITEGGLVHSEYAPFLEKIFETHYIANRDFSDLLFKHSQLDDSVISGVKKAALGIIGGEICDYNRLSPRLIKDVYLMFSDCRSKNIELSWAPFMNDSGQVIKLLVTVRDVTEHHKAEEQKEILAAVFKNSSEPVVVFDNSLYIQAVNAAFSSLMSMEDEYLVGSNLSMVLRNTHDGTFFDAMRSQIKACGSWDGEIHCESNKSNDKVRWLTISEIGHSQSLKNATFLGSFSDILRRQKVEDELRYLANYDALTDLPNRRLFSERVQHAVAIAKRNNGGVVLFFIDLNRFKQVNDSYGHTVGDELLVQVTQRLSGFVRDSDTLCRLGGDEFTILIENPASRDNIEKFANRLLQQFTRPFIVDSHELRTGASIGISVYPDDADTVETLMVNADVAMYSAKEKGVGYQFFETKMNEATGNRLGLENDLHRALDNDELFLTYQPKIELDTGKMVGAEVLLRWQHPVLGLVSPVQFIPLAEETGLIIPIGHWVLETACRNLALWRKKGLSPINLAVNVSVKQFQSVDFTKQVKAVLEETSIDPNNLELEVTESLLMDTESTSIETMTSLKEMGISISIDDFGTGYSSLQYLSKFPIDYLKIDRSFVMGLDTDGKSIAIIRAIIAMAQGLGLEVVAEGVEYEAQARLLREFGCQLAQGFLYSRPLKEFDFVKHLAPQRLTDDNLTFLKR